MPAALLALALGGCAVEQAQRWPNAVELDRQVKALESLAAISEAASPTAVEAPPTTATAPPQAPSPPPAPAAVAAEFKPTAAAPPSRASNAAPAQVATLPTASNAAPAPVPTNAPTGEAPDDATADAGLKRTTSVDPAIPLIETPPVVPPAPGQYPIDLSTALRLAEVENPEIAGVRQRIFEQMGVLQGAYALMIPTLNAGTNYHGHTGNLQRSSGRILNLSEQSLYYGGGARTLAAETLGVPAVNITSALTDAIFAPLVENQRLDGVRLNAVATTNQILLEVATLYFDLVAAEASLYLRRETASEGAELARRTQVYAEVGQGREADARRAATEYAMLQREVQRAEEEVAVASTRLARRLHLDPVIRIHPVSPQVEPIPLVDLLVSPEDLVQAAIRRRPEVGATGALIGAAESDLQREKMRPFLPNVWLGFSGGAFGGGSNLSGPLLGRFAGRTDFDVRVFWTFQNLGMGNLALIRNRQGVVGEAVAAQSLAVSQIRRDVSEAQSVARAEQLRIEQTRNQLERAREGFREELDRIRNTVSRSIEAVTFLELLDKARQDHLRAVIGYNQAQFQLFVALGSPPPLAPGAESAPLPAAPVAFPPTPPPSRGRSPLDWTGQESPAAAANIALAPAPPPPPAR